MLAGFAVKSIVDYRFGVPMPSIPKAVNSKEQILPSANVLELKLEGGSKVIFRPSGTEPKIKAYLSVNRGNCLEADDLMRALKGDVSRLLK